MKELKSNPNYIGGGHLKGNSKQRRVMFRKILRAFPTSEVKRLPRFGHGYHSENYPTLGTRMDINPRRDI